MDKNEGVMKDIGIRRWSGGGSPISGPQDVCLQRGLQRRQNRLLANHPRTPTVAALFLVLNTSSSSTSSSLLVKVGRETLDSEFMY